MKRLTEIYLAWSIRTKLILAFTAITVIPIVALSYYVSIEFTREHEKEMIEASNRQIAQVDTALRFFFDSVRDSMLELALDPALQNVDDSVTPYMDKQGNADGLVKMIIPHDRGKVETEIYRRFIIYRTFHKNIEVVSMGIESNGGYVQNPTTTCATGFDPRKQDWYRMATRQLANRALGIQAHPSADGSAVHVGFVKAVVDDFGKLKGVLVVEMTLDSLTTLIQDYSWGKYGHIVLVDEDGVILADPVKPERLYRNIREFYAGVPDRLADIRTGTFNASADGRTFLLAIHASSTHTWKIIGVADKTDMFETAAHLRTEIQLLALVMMLLALAWGAYMAQRITTPIREVVAAAEGIAAGDLAAPQKMQAPGLPGRKDEIGSLGNSIVMMAAAIERSFQEREENFRRMREQDQKVAEELHRLDRLKDDLLATVSHELKTPLHGIIGLADSLGERLAGTRDKPAVRDLDLIAGSGKRLVGLVNDIMDFVTLRSSQVRLQFRPVRVQDCAQEVITLCRVHVKTKHVVLENRVPAGLPPVCADGDRLTQILHNLVENAIKFTEIGTIFIGAKRQGDTVRITVADTGSGVPADKLDFIFQPFEKIQVKDRKTEGIGLGLSIVKTLVELHGGKITVESKPSRGSQFIFSLPVWKGGDYAEGAPVAPTPGASPLQDKAAGDEEQSTGPEPFPAGGEVRKILVVDDDEVNLSVVKNYLAGARYSLKCLQSGEAALTELAAGSYDLVLLDVMMPGLNGLATCREIRKHKSTIPIIMLTVRNSPEDVPAAFRAGANDYITKPFHKKELVARIEAQLSLRARYLAEVRALQAQIRPHFFYNAINTIANQCRKDPAKARELLVHLGTYLQNCFNYDQEFVPLAQELELIDAHVKLEQARLGDRLKVSFDVEDYSECRIPILILQPLVENAIRHGIFPKMGGGTVDVTCRRQNGQLVFTVKDDGVGIPQYRLQQLQNGTLQARGGIGIANVDARLRSIYGTGLEITTKEDEGTTVTFKITEPLRTAD